jgi:hypothetical protein
LEASSGQRIKEYVAGAFVAYSVVLLSGEAFRAFFAWMGQQVESICVDLVGLFVCLHLVGGALGGYLVGQRRREDIIRAGAITALIAYVFEFSYYFIFVGAFYNSLYAMLGFFFGGIAGANYARYRRARKILQERGH